MGMDLGVLGSPVAADRDIVEVRIAEPEVETGRIVCEVLDTDRFGNVRLNVRPAHLTSAGLDQAWQLEIEHGGAIGRARIGIMSYGQVEAGCLRHPRRCLGMDGRHPIPRRARPVDLGVQPGDPVWLNAG